MRLKQALNVVIWCLKLIQRINGKKFVLDYVKEHSDVAGIIYCSTRKQVEELHEAFQDQNIQSYDLS